MAGISLDDSLGLPEKPVAVKELADAGDARAISIFDTICTYLGYSIPHNADFYPIENILILGRVTSEGGGKRIKTRALEILEQHFPHHAENIVLVTPNEKNKRHGQAVAAASVPVLS